MPYTLIDGTTHENIALHEYNDARPGTALYYDGTPGLGTLTLSISTEAGMDIHGNLFPAGICHVDRS